LKKILAIVTAISCFNAAFAQADKNDLSVAVDFKTLAAANTLGNQQTTSALQSYKSGGAAGSQFFTREWCEGSVTTATHETINNYQLLYDKVNQDLYIRQKDSNLVIQADKSQVATFSLNINGKQLLFVPAGKYGNQFDGSYFEALAQGANYSLFKLTKTHFERADYSDMLKVRNGEANDAFIDNITYYLYHNNTLEKITVKEKAVRKALPAETQKIDAFLSAHKSDEFNEELLANLVTALN